MLFRQLSQKHRRGFSLLPVLAANNNSLTLCHPFKRLSKNPVADKKTKLLSLNNPPVLKQKRPTLKPGVSNHAMCELNNL